MLLTCLIIIVGEIRKLECHCCVIDMLNYNCWRDTEIGVSLLCYLTCLIIIVGEIRKLECHCCVIDIRNYNCWRDTEI